ncbi:MAG: type II toxin-antitoxin system VapC family toxin [Caldilineaceae bacterium]
MSNESVPCYILDSFALLAFLENEAGAAIVQEKLQAAAKGELQLYLPTINLGEMVYIIERERGLSDAQLALAQIRQLPIHLLETDLSRILAAAHIKAQTPISYADAFVVAAAHELQATILTGDPEFRKIGPSVQIDWLPQA